MAVTWPSTILHHLAASKSVFACHSIRTIDSRFSALFQLAPLGFESQRDERATRRKTDQDDRYAAPKRNAIMMSKKILVPALGILVSLGTAVSASDYDREDYYERRGPMPFEVMDLNGDGVVTAQEHAQVRAERQAYRTQQGYPMRRAASAPGFESIDLDDDGSIDRDELSTWQAQKMTQRGRGCAGRWGS
jgi:hypothetical protein